MNLFDSVAKLIGIKIKGALAVDHSIILLGIVTNSIMQQNKVYVIK